MAKKDCPIVYASDPFYYLTGYSKAEVLGQNCRFLQAPGAKVKKGTARKYVDEELLKSMCMALETNTEFQAEVTNFKKDGTKFANYLTMIPIRWDSQDYRYCVGLQCDLNDV